MPSGIGIGLGVASAVGGLVSGLSGSETNTTKNLAPPSAQELALQQDSFQNYLKQQALADQQEQGIAGAGALQGQARDYAGKVLDGSAFNLTPQQQAAIQGVRDATVTQGTANINNFVDDRLKQLQGDAAARGVRGQAYSDIQASGVNEGTRQLGSMINQANTTAAQQAMDNPYRQAQLQSSNANAYSSMQDNMRQQAISNRNQLQNPALMNTLQTERNNAAGTTTNTPGNIGSALGGVAGGVGSALGTMASFNKATAPTGGNTYNYAPSNQSSNGGFGLGVPQLAHGGWVPGRSQFIGDTTANDVVPIMASPEELMIPKSHSQHRDLAIAYVKHMFDQKKEGKV